MLPFNVEQAARQNIVVQQGSSFERLLDFLNLNITDYSLSGCVYPVFAKRKPSVGFAFAKIDERFATMTLTPEQTTLLDAADYAYFVELYEGTTLRFRVLEGTATVRPIGSVCAAS